MRLRELIERLEWLEKRVESIVDKLEGEHDPRNPPTQIVLRAGVPHNN